ncbi:MAG: methylmalonyl Co-A mutase-associated GTPase MeaB [Bdellovibrionales bacterium]|nr:methylmalonyl Co-A mutase-associated GTPase MeaB [Bdellovibrionales bacterium]
MSAQEGSDKLAQAKAGDFQAFSKFLTWLEKAPAKDVFALKELIEPSRTAFRFGITGPPGAGKSTLVGRLISHLRKQNLKIGVLAVDPSSPFSQGAILGDRIRYSEHFLDPAVFIRSLGTRGSLGGLSSAAFLMARAFDVCAFDVLLIETVGVGQTELDVLHVADQVCVVLVPESGDSVQAMKAGLMEIADVYVVNKADRPGADGLVREIEAAQHDGGSSTSKPVLKAVASEDKGVEELARLILADIKSERPAANRRDPKRLREEARSILRREWENRIDQQLSHVSDPAAFAKLFQTK